MTVQTTTNKAGPFIGNNAVTQFSTGFRVDGANDLQVIYTDGMGVETILNPAVYSVSGFGADAGITVTYPLSGGSAMGPQERLTLLRTVANTQSTSITNQGGFYPKVIENALDRVVYQCQQLAEKLTRAVTVQVSSTQDPSAVFNSIAINAAAAAASANSANNTWLTFHNQYLGAFAVDPTVDNSGNPLAGGALYWNGASARLRIYSAGAGWQDTAVAQPASFASNVFSGNGAQTTFTLSSTPSSVNAILVSINGVTQRPVMDFSFSGTSLTFTSAPPAGTGNILALVASTLAIGTPADGSVTASKIQDGAVVTSKLPDGTVTAVKLDPATVQLGRLLNRVVFTTVGANSYNRNAAANYVVVHVLGGGGGASGDTGAASYTGHGVPGCGGGYALKKILASDIVLAYGSGPVPVTVGGGGNGGAAGSNNGATGGTSSFGSWCSATGGSGGLLGADVVVQGGIGTGGDINLRGDASVWWNYYGDTGRLAPGGRGAGPFGGPGARGHGNPSTRPIAGINADPNTGGGGSGGATSYQSGSCAGGNGGSGIVIVEEYA
jgi:hypothetical protein